MFLSNMKIPILIICFNIMTSMADWPKDKSIPLSGEICYPDLGCISYTDEWFDTIFRPVNEVPEDVEVINTAYVLFVWDAPVMKAHLFTTPDEVLTRINRSLETRIIIHGWKDNAHEGWVPEMAKVLLSHDKGNVIGVDWFRGAAKPYLTACANIRVVALQVAKLMQQSDSEQGLDSEKVHIIGHGIGAHCAGYVGNNIKGSLRRITGLDPSRTCFEHMNQIVRLDDSDADFVDIIHTDCNTIIGAGVAQQSGHVDFYPNGMQVQPGCPTERNVLVPLKKLMNGEWINMRSSATACSHRRAYDLFINSITADCEFIACSCSSFKLFEKNACKENGKEDPYCTILGIDAEPYADSQLHARSPLFLYTDVAFPYCTFVHWVRVSLLNPKEVIFGTLTVKLVGSKGHIYKTLIEHELIDATKIKKSIPIKSVYSIGEIDSLLIIWVYEYLITEPKSLCISCKKEIDIDYVEVTHFGNKTNNGLCHHPLYKYTIRTIKFCPSGKNGIASGSTAMFKKCTETS